MIQSNEQYILIMIPPQYLAKSYVYSGYRDEQKKRMFVDTVRSTLEHMIVSPKDHPDIKLLAELNGDEKRHVMDELACFVPGTFLLAADTIPELHDIVGIASDLLESCVLAWTSTKTGIAPEIFGWVDPKTGEFPVPKSDRTIELADKYGVFPVTDHYILRPGKYTVGNLILMNSISEHVLAFRNLGIHFLLLSLHQR